MTMLATWTTHFIPSPILNGNGANIRVPAKRINDTVVKPGQLFQFIDAILPVTDPPYAKGAFIHNGQFVLDPAKGILGGGMCSASTTMFNAALRAGLKIVERHNHAVYIPRYPVGLDATVFSTGNSDGQDVKFVNDMKTPILIRAYGLKRKVTFEIWGVDDGRTVKLSSPVITNVVVAPAYYVYTDDLPPGVTQHVQDRYDGFHSVVVRTVKDANGNVIWKDTFNSQYSMLPGLTNLGRKPGDPPAGTRIPNPNAPPSNP
jgi:vancomycin resistance protein YoaR